VPGSQLTRLAGLLEAQVDRINESHMARMRSELPQSFLQAGAWEDARAFSRESILAEVRALRGGATLPASCPEVDAEAARGLALAGGSIDPMLSGYRSGHLAQWEAWFALTEDEVEDPGERRALLERGSRFFFEYADRLSRFVTEIYSQERERMLRSREQRRVQLVRDVLDGSEPEAAELGYDLTATHLGVLAWGPDAAEALRDLAGQLDSRLLVIGVREQTFWGWLGRTASSGDRAESLRRFAPPAGTRLAAGGEASGVEGFRRTHAEAQSARRGARSQTRAVTLYEDVVLETLAARDSAAAAAFVAAELRGIDGDDATSRKLRETLDAYFAAGQNAAASAAALGVHEQTVAHRLRAIEERTARGVAARRAELEVALRLRSYLAGS
jgi:DNA-binding PucR family transcriptional regulator